MKTEPLRLMLRVTSIYFLGEALSVVRGIYCGPTIHQTTTNLGTVSDRKSLLRIQIDEGPVLIRRLKALQDDSEMHPGESSLTVVLKKLTQLLICRNKAVA